MTTLTLKWRKNEFKWSIYTKLEYICVVTSHTSRYSNQGWWQTVCRMTDSCGRVKSSGGIYSAAKITDKYSVLTHANLTDHAWRKNKQKKPHKNKNGNKLQCNSRQFYNVPIQFRTALFIWYNRFTLLTSFFFVGNLETLFIFPTFQWQFIWNKYL